MRQNQMYITKEGDMMWPSITCRLTKCKEAVFAEFSQMSKLVESA